MLTNLELIKKAEECADKLKLEKAISLYDEGIRRWPNDTLIIDQYSDLLIQFGEVEKAKEVSISSNRVQSWCQPIYVSDALPHVIETHRICLCS